ncbi:MAG: hypothetical protein LC768_13050, partial [Acidobacteria bacterium]|nr:hypothetical protein [Acidobacteriota bacterium]
MCITTAHFINRRFAEIVETAPKSNAIHRAEIPFVSASDRSLKSRSLGFQNFVIIDSLYL